MTGLKSGSGDDLWGDDSASDDETDDASENDADAASDAEIEETPDTDDATSTSGRGDPNRDSGAEADDDSSTEDETSTSLPSTTDDSGSDLDASTGDTGNATTSQPYIVRRAVQDKSVQFEREERLTFFVHDDVADGERDLITDLESALGRDVPKFDVREAVYRAALRNPDDVLDELLQMGYSAGEE